MILQSHTVDNPVTRPACGFLVVPFGTADGCWKLFDHRVRTYVLGLRIPDDTSAVKQHVGHRKLAKPRETMRYFFPFVAVLQMRRAFSAECIPKHNETDHMIGLFLLP